MASVSPPNFPPSVRSHKLSYHTTPSKLTYYSSTRLSSSSPRVLDSSSTVCRCHRTSDNEESPRRWFQQNVRNVIKWFDDFLDGYRNNNNNNIKVDEDDDDDVSLKKEGEDEWDWDRWKKHFDDVDQQERIVDLLQIQLKHAVANEDYEDAARIKVAIAAAANNDTVGRVMSQLNKAIKEERYKDAAFVRDYASAGLVGWWAGFSDDSKDPYGRIIRISAEHGRYLARSYSPRQLAKAADGAPLFEIFITMNDKGEYKHQAVYLKRKEGPQDFSLFSPKSSNVNIINSVNTVDPTGDKGDVFTKDKEDTDDEEYSFENILRDMIPGAKDVKIKVMNVTSPGKIDRDLISKVVEQIMDEEDEDDDDEDDVSDDEDDGDIVEVKDETETDGEQYDIDIDIDAGNTIIDGGYNSQIAVKVVVGGLVQKVSNDTSHKDLVRMPAQLEKKNRSSFTFSIQKENQNVQSSNAQSSNKKDSKNQGARSIDSVMLNLAKYIGTGKIPMKVLKDVNQLINLSLSQAQNRQPLSGSTTFNRIEIPSNRDPLNGLYVGAHGIYTSEVIQLKRKFGQWQEDGNTKKFSNLEFYEYVEAVKITGDPYVPAGQVAFRAKVGTKYQLPHRGIIPEEFGVIARYRGQGRLADPGFQNPRWVDGELVILDGKYINGGPVVGFVYWAPESHFLVFFNQLRLQE
ncbi:protein EXECUTER 1, chloroplastic-like [Bidens hawaiensis]|uniref:protein EXECUTER 1, chloroplastic-like n=1 Tax=Bidens hawaiensis TaxID=980011 RepID=UPI0040496A65